MARGVPLIDSGKPVVLHVLHSWGGGVDYFARDLQAGDRHRKHYFLKSHSRDSLPPYGKELCLYEALDREPVASWHLSAPVMDTDLHSPEVAAILQSILEKWAVGAVIVSSLIGHSLDVLGTGLPTALAVHDVYPFWPLLHDANSDDHSIDHLKQSLHENGDGNIFATHPAEYWIAIRDELISMIRQKGIVCISPSLFAKARVCRIDPRLNDAKWHVLPHGMRDQPRPEVASQTQLAGKLKVLVPGHINGGKGEQLLGELLPVLPDGIELVLLGSAHLSEKFSGENISTIADYPREQLAEYVARIKPDIAMLASTVPETYGYVLSEMLQLAVPVVCANIGAYAERGAELPGMTLVSPERDSFLAALTGFRDNPEWLSKQKENLPVAFPDLQQMANAWAAILPANPPRWCFEFTDDPAIDAEVKMNLQLTHITEILKAVHEATEKNTQSGHAALESISRQQTGIDSMLDTLGTQGQQLIAILEKQNEMEAAIAKKNKEIAWLTTHADELKTAFQEQLLLSKEQEKSFLAALEKTQLEFEARLTQLGNFADERNKDLHASVKSLADELSVMKAKRAWRFFRFLG